MDQWGHASSDIDVGIWWYPSVWFISYTETVNAHAICYISVELRENKRGKGTFDP